MLIEEFLSIVHVIAGEKCEGRRSRVVGSVVFFSTGGVEGVWCRGGVIRQTPLEDGYCRSQYTKYRDAF